MLNCLLADSSSSTQSSISSAKAKTPVTGSLALIQLNARLSNNQSAIRLNNLGLVDCLNLNTEELVEMNVGGL